MTEQEWLTCDDPTPMLEFLRRKASERKLRLFAVGCCRQVWPPKLDARLASPLAVAERFADGLASRRELTRAHAKASDGLITASAGVTGCGDAALWSAVGFATAAPGYAHIAMVVRPAVSSASDGKPKRAKKERAAQARLLRCIFGNPFRPVAIASSWRTSTVGQLAQAIYDERAFDRMPILADALEVAGCTNQEVLAHCRGPGPHLRGCWVVDLILGKS